MKVYVLDASVILSYLLSEETIVVEEFEKLLKEARKNRVKLISSKLLPLEVANGLRYTLSDSALAVRVLETFLDLPLEYVDFTKGQLQRALQLAYTTKTSFYDASYHILAIELEGVFLTCDKKYFQKAEKFGFIRLL